MATVPRHTDQGPRHGPSYTGYSSVASTLTTAARPTASMRNARPTVLQRTPTYTLEDLVAGPSAASPTNSSPSSPSATRWPHSSSAASHGSSKSWKPFADYMAPPAAYPIGRGGTDEKALIASPTECLRRWNVAQDTFCFASPERLELLLGYSSTDLLEVAFTSTSTTWWRSLLHPDDARHIVPQYSRFVDGTAASAGPRYMTDHYRLRAKDGSWVTVIDQLHCLRRDTNGKAQEVVGLWSNPVQRVLGEQIWDEVHRAAEDGVAATVAAGAESSYRRTHSGMVEVTKPVARAALMRSIRQSAMKEDIPTLKAMVENSSAALIYTDRARKPTCMNPAAVRMTGYTLDEIKHLTLHDALHHHHPDGRPFPASECGQDGARAPPGCVLTGESAFIHKDGHFYDAAWSVTSLHDIQPHRNVGAVMEIRDISAQQRMERERLALAVEAEQMQARSREAEAHQTKLNDFVSYLSHEIRNPLHALTANAEFLGECLQKLEDWLTAAPGRLALKHASVSSAVLPYPCSAPSSASGSVGGAPESAHGASLAVSAAAAAIDHAGEEPSSVLGSMNPLLGGSVTAHTNTTVTAAVGRSAIPPALLPAPQGPFLSGIAPPPPVATLEHDVTLAKVGSGAATASNDTPSSGIGSPSLLLGQSPKEGDMRTRSDAMAAYAEEPRIYAGLNVEETDGREWAMPLEILKEMRSYLESVKACCQHQRLITDNVLDLSRLEAGKVELLPEVFDPATLARQCLAMLAGRILEKRLVARVEAHYQGWRLVSGDALRLSQVILNLCTNSLKFTSEGGAMVVIINEPRLLSDGTYRVKFTVQDNGCGMTPEETCHLFSRFAQTSRTVFRQHGGSGLGLAISQEIVKLMGGAGIHVESEKGKGTAMSFEVVCAQPDAPPLDGGPAQAASLFVENSPALTSMPMVQLKSSSTKSASSSAAPADLAAAPLVAPACADAPADAPAESAAMQPPRFGRVLVADDSTTNRVVMEKMLSRLGYQVTSAKDGKEALERWLDPAERINCIFMDSNMPIMTGLEATQKIRELEASIPDSRAATPVPIIAISGNARPEQIREGLACGLSDYLIKPAGLKEIDAALKKWERAAATSET